MCTIYRAPVAIAGEKCLVAGMTAQKNGHMVIVFVSCAQRTLLLLLITELAYCRQHRHHMRYAMAKI
jgi:hypothetical protein